MDSHRGRAASDDARLDKPTGWGGGGGGDSSDCPGLDDLEHHHHHHTTAKGLGKHLKLWYRHNWGERFVRMYGLELVLKTLDELTDTYGEMLDAPPSSYRKPARRPSYFGRTGEGPEPEIKFPAGFIIAHVRQASELAAELRRETMDQDEENELARARRRRAAGGRG